MILKTMIDQEKIGRAWDSKIGPKVAKKWFNVPLIVEHLAYKSGDKYNPGANFIDPFLRRLAAIGPFESAISIGCGVAASERKLLMHGIVRHFDLFELAADRIARAKDQFAHAGVLDRASMAVEDAFAGNPAENYDLVYWKSSLHHMMSAHQAVEWSWRALKPGGVFAMWDFVGPSRFQWSERNLHYANAFRHSLPDRLFPAGKRDIKRPSVESMIEMDPSEAADSGNIVSAVKRYFPQADIRPLGGAIYHFGFRGILEKVLSDQDSASIIRQALIIDDLLQVIGENHFAFCIVRK